MALRLQIVTTGKSMSWRKNKDNINIALIFNIAELN